MTQRRSAGARLRAGAALVPALALATTGMVAASAGAVTAAPAPVQPAQGAAASEAWINYVQPRAEKAFGTDKKVGKKDGAKQHDAIAKAMEVDRKHPKGNPVAARQLAKLEAKAIKTGQNPKQIKSQYKGAKATQQARLLTILVEFNENANDDFSGAHVSRASTARTPACPARPRTAPSTTASRTRPEAALPGQQLDVGAGLLPRSTSTRCSTPRRASPSGSAPTSRGLTASRLRHLRLHHEEHVRGDVQGRLHRLRCGHPVGQGRPLRGLLRRHRLPPGRER